MSIQFKNAKQAAQLLAEKLGDRAKAGAGHIIAIGDDASVLVDFTGEGSSLSLRATVAPCDHEFSKTRKDWTSVKAEETRDNGVVSGYRADLDALAEKVSKLIEPMIGLHAKAVQMREEQQAKDAELLAQRAPVAQRLVNSGLAVYSQNGDTVVCGEYRKATATVVSKIGAEVKLTGLKDCVRLQASVPYAKAERVLSFLHDALEAEQPCEADYYATVIVELTDGQSECVIVPVFSKRFSRSQFQEMLTTALLDEDPKRSKVRSIYWSGSITRHSDITVP